MSEVIATAEFQGATRAAIHANAINGFEAFLDSGVPYYVSYEIIIGEATVKTGLDNMRGEVVSRVWSATCHLVSKETAA